MLPLGQRDTIQKEISVCFRKVYPGQMEIESKGQEA